MRAAIVSPRRLLGLDRFRRPCADPAPVSNAVQILSASRLAALADSVPAGASTSIQLVKWDGLSNMMSRRDTSGIHERHEAFSDIFVVQRGRARLLYGGTAEGERASSPGEWRGGTIRGGTEAEIKPGDIVVIPAGVPHQLLLHRRRASTTSSSRLRSLPADSRAAAHAVDAAPVDFLGFEHVQLIIPDGKERRAREF
jgi:mannose-6-phosphate isomerase-like protein (cupin superfamily)